MSIAIYNPFDEPEKMRAIEALAIAIDDNVGTTLAAAQAAADRLYQTSKLATGTREDVLLIKQSIRDIVAVMKSLLSIAGRQQVFELKNLDVRIILVELKPLLGRLLGDDVVVEISYAPDLWPIKADLQLLEMIVLALSVNAGEAMPDGGTLRWCAANISANECHALYKHALPATDHVTIEAIDTGKGIRADSINRIFEPFFSTKSGRGNGTGLTTVYGAIKKMNGHILVVSENEKGTMFRVFFPRLELVG